MDRLENLKQSVFTLATDLKKEKQIHENYEANYLKFRKRQVDKLASLKNDILQRILQKESDKKSFLEILRVKEAEKTKFKVILKDLKKQRYKSLERSNNFKCLKKTGSLKIKKTDPRIEGRFLGEKQHPLFHLRARLARHASLLTPNSRNTSSLVIFDLSSINLEIYIKLLISLILCIY